MALKRNVRLGEHAVVGPAGKREGDDLEHGENHGLYNVERSGIPGGQNEVDHIQQSVPNHHNRVEDSCEDARERAGVVKGSDGILAEPEGGLVDEEERKEPDGQSEKNLAGGGRKERGGRERGSHLIGHIQN